VVVSAFIRTKEPMKEMTQKEAQAEAVRRWGSRGTVTFRSRRRNGRGGRLARYCCTVGNGHPGSVRSVEGQGNTWREAFEDAARSDEMNS
jgi:hypothetical protein